MICLYRAFEFESEAAIGWAVFHSKHLVHFTRTGARDFLRAISYTMAFTTTWHVIKHM